MDVLVAQKDYLDKHRQDVEGVVKAYLETAAAQRKAPDGMIQLVQADSTRLVAAGKLTKPLTDAEAGNVVQGIRWKTTRENYAHFGLLTDDDVKDIESLEDAIKKITLVLVKTGAISHSVKESSLVDREVCASLLKENFGIPFDPDKDWAKLRPAAGVMAEPISFRRGSSDLPADAEDTLQAAAQAMKAQADLYLEIQGSPRAVTPEDASWPRSAPKRRSVGCGTRAAWRRSV